MTEPNADTTGATSPDAGTQLTGAATPPADTTAATKPASPEQPAAEETTSLTSDAAPKDAEQAEDKKTEDETDKAKPEGAPEKYEFKAPENVALNDEVIGKFSEVARELNLTQDAAQKLIDSVGPVMAERQANVLKQARADWKGQSEVDKEFGGDNYAANLATAKKALTAFGSPELVSLLNQSGFGEHPEIIRLFYRAGKSISEDRIVSGGISAGDSRDPAAVLYGKP